MAEREPEEIFMLQLEDLDGSTFLSIDAGGGREWPRVSPDNVIAMINGNGMKLDRDQVRLLRDALTKWLGERIVEIETTDDETGGTIRTRTETQMFDANIIRAGDRVLVGGFEGVAVPAEAADHNRAWSHLAWHESHPHERCGEECQWAYARARQNGSAAIIVRKP